MTGGSSATALRPPHARHIPSPPTFPPCPPPPLSSPGEAALYLGVLNALSSGLPPGTKLEDPKLHGALIVLGLWMLTGSILGFVAALRRNSRAARGFYVVTLIDLLLATLIGVFSFMSGASFNALIAQVPALALNIYFVLVVRSWRQLLDEEGKAGRYGSSSGGSGGPAGGATAPGVSGAGEADVDELDVDVEDLDLDLEAPSTAAAPTGKASGGAKSGAAASASPAPRPAKRSGDDD